MDTKKVETAYRRMREWAADSRKSERRSHGLSMENRRAGFTKIAEFYEREEYSFFRRAECYKQCAELLRAIVFD